MWDRLLRNARVVDPVNGRDGVMDVAVKDGRIAAVGPNLQGEASEVEDLTGLVVMPGLIDPHLHLGSMFGSAYGTRMAAAAGVTTRLDMAGPVDEILETSKTCGAGINVAMLEGFSPMKHCGTMTPTREQLDRFIEVLDGQRELPDGFTASMIMRDTPPAARMSAGIRSSAMTAHAPACSAILACSGVVTSIITPPLSICANSLFNWYLFSMMMNLLKVFTFWMSPSIMLLWHEENAQFEDIQSGQFAERSSCDYL